ncbi:MAG: hypothetical protein BJ554DRAFT_5138 [Olpidium bornovanus]|uniref:Uncharacterized protein n=1 Tax=Olpidium bornovanus TaxID=278681 RepID=A0A8H7ZIR0_9FUNG|nr:MAG: hypothetical protein BJ554DRAFT_5138 [Olpidium bornovanus]
MTGTNVQAIDVESWASGKARLRTALAAMDRGLSHGDVSSEMNLLEEDGLFGVLGEQDGLHVQRPLKAVAGVMCTKRRGQMAVLQLP